MGNPICPSCRYDLLRIQYKGETHFWCENRGCKFYSEQYAEQGLELVFRYIENDMPTKQDMPYSTGQADDEVEC